MSREGEETSQTPNNIKTAPKKDWKIERDRQTDKDKRNASARKMWMRRFKSRCIQFSRQVLLKQITKKN